MRDEDTERDGPIGARDLPRILPFEPAAASRRLGWVGLEAARFQATPAFQLNDIALTHHMLALFARPPKELDVRFEGSSATRRPPPNRLEGDHLPVQLARGGD
jgi:hypothetical protein